MVSMVFFCLFFLVVFDSFLIFLKQIKFLISSFKQCIFYCTWAMSSVFWLAIIVLHRIFFDYELKGKIKMFSSFTPPHVFPKVYDLLFSVEHNRRYFDKRLSVLFPTFFKISPFVLRRKNYTILQQHEGK